MSENNVIAGGNSTESDETMEETESGIKQSSIAEIQHQIPDASSPNVPCDKSVTHQQGLYDDRDVSPENKTVTFPLQSSPTDTVASTDTDIIMEEKSEDTVATSSSPRHEPSLNTMAQKLPELTIAVSPNREEGDKCTPTGSANVMMNTDGEHTEGASTGVQVEAATEQESTDTSEKHILELSKDIVQVA